MWLMEQILKRAKLFNNCIAKPMISIPLAIENHWFTPRLRNVAANDLVDKHTDSTQNKLTPTATCPSAAICFGSA